MKATWHGAVIAESDDTVVVEGNHYFPEAALDRRFIVASNHRSTCGWKRRGRSAADVPAATLDGGRLQKSWQCSSSPQHSEHSGPL